MCELLLSKSEKFGRTRTGTFYKCDLKMEPPSKDLLRELECPVCMEYMISPIFMCEGRHNICNHCRRVLNKCPTCRQPFITARNIYLENLSKQVQYPCINRKMGCKVTTFHDRICKHQDECPFGSQMCPFSKVTKQKCRWRGTLTEIKKHLKTEHKELILKMHGKQAVTCTNYTYCRALFTLGEVFLYYSKLTSKMFYSCVMYVGPKEKSKKFRYRIDMTSTDKKESVSMCFVTANYMENIEGILDSGHCAALHYNFVMNCTRVFKGLPIEVEIFPV
ncbi:hypothetical protein C0J52_27363 [Blattella germanica]|nr:hypothetical protein C0J52_27363 [Blattella germanica]